MTTICSMHDAVKGGVWIASDTKRSFGDLGLNLATKWAVHENWAIGMSGRVRLANIMHKHWPQIIRDTQDIHDISLKLRQLVQYDGFKPQDEKSPWWNMGTIITDSSNIWTVGSDFSYSHIPQGQFVADGSGWQIAQGATLALGK